jgi:hypothetical protein
MTIHPRRAIRGNQAALSLIPDPSRVGERMVAALAVPRRVIRTVNEIRVVNYSRSPSW